MKNIENADMPKSSTAMLPERPSRVSGNVRHTLLSSSKSVSSRLIPSFNYCSLRLEIPKYPILGKLDSFRIAVRQALVLHRNS